MKNILRIAVTVLILSISSLAVAGQTFDGHGFSSVSIQRQTDPDRIEKTFREGIFGTDEEKALIFRDDLSPNVTREQIMDSLYHNIAMQMHCEFDPGNPDEYEISFHIILTHSAEWKRFCETHEDTYLLNQAGAPLQRGNPGESWASEHKDCRIEAFIKDRKTGGTATLFADCFNVLFPIHEYAKRNTPPPAQNDASPGPSVKEHKIYFTASPNNIMAGDSVTLHWDASGYSRVDISGIGDHLDPSGNFMVSPDRTTTYFLRAYPGNCPANVIVYVKQKDLQVSTKGWFCRNAGWVVPVGIVVIAGVVYVACHHPAPRDHVYSTEIQDTSGQPGLGGDGGGSTHTYAAQISKGFGLTTHWTANAGFVSFTPNQAGKIKPVLGVHFAFALR